ncbi:hypothetical protein E2C00_00450 [Streptomyces sp. WAC05374]|uniref:hypothetical protein n=1 Tax=Streptomyces sp. WAC05374 TaxID=2487420 RepID=UPI000F87083C|nr:hypothetical protein [Streptomyces sp. WAC05374]RST19611.1 hypothetical protein EF905_00495 [Streptomyces sp. WAC05374]TDF50052.1 hypothetical protein E2B92_00425 [Streptomyces sp. WAC05374]TDF57778.1 hypothetical protein E2C02_08215 [Streptomyces sp. WAC05374]TDF60306.1 hypothetical protein E2C00_00450 [Streptomyces sp. WAC05374]
MTDEGRPGDVRGAWGCAALLLAMLLVIDGLSGDLNAPRAALWTALAALLFVTLLPPRVTAGPGWLTVRGLLREHSVRTDLLVSVRWSDGVAKRLVLRDLTGDQVVLDPRVLIASPALWHLFDAGARASLGRGTLLCGAAALRELSRCAEREVSRTVLKISGVDRRRPE